MIWEYEGYYHEGGQPLDFKLGDGTVTPCKDGSYCCGNGTITQSRCVEKGGFIPDEEITPSGGSASPGSIDTVTYNFIGY